jgi:GPI mannosyltransferase 3
VARPALGAVLALAGAVRLWFGWNELGIYWPDEIHQSLEPAHRLAFGYGLRAWEYIEGARHWAFPALIAPVMKLGSVLSGGAPEGYLWLLRMLFSALGVLATWGTHRLARSYQVDPLIAAAGAALFGLSAVALYFSHRALSEVASLAPVVWGFVLASEREGSRRRLVLGASLLGLATLIRLHNALFCLGALALVLERRGRRDAWLVFGTLVAWALMYGTIDRLTWGGWFHSAIHYLKFNLLEGKAAGWGTAPFGYYVRVAWLAMPGPCLVLAVMLPMAARRAPALWLTCAASVLLLSWTPHKEFRFVLPTLPLLFALGAIGASANLEALRALWAGRWIALAMTAIAVHSMTHSRSLRFGQLGAYEQERPEVSAWGDAAGVNRLLLVGHRQPDLCALKIEATHLAWTGGQSYLHRSVPLYSHLGPPRELGFYNYVIGVAGSEPGARVVARDGALALLRLPVDSCRSDPGYSDRLP